MATYHLDFKFNCDNIWSNGSGTGVNSPCTLTHNSRTDQVALYIDNQYFSLANDITQDLILVNVSDTVQINASNQNGSDGDYDCVVVQFIAMAFGPDTAGSDMKHLKPSDMTSTSAPFADVTFNDPLNISVPVLDFSDPQPTTWQSANEGETTAGPYGAMKTRNAAISGKRIFRAPNVSFQTQNSGVLQFRVVVAISYQNNGPQYYSFDPYMKIS